MLSRWWCPGRAVRQVVRSFCKAAASYKAFVTQGCRLALVVDLVDLLDVVRHDPRGAEKQFVRIRDTADYCRMPAFRGELKSFNQMSVRELAAELEKKMRRDDKSFSVDAEWHTFKRVRIAGLLKQAGGDKNPKKAASRVLSVALAQHIVDGTLSQATVDLAAKIAGGGLEGSLVVEGIVTVAVQRLGYADRQGTEDPNMTGRGQQLTPEQRQRLSLAVVTLSSTSTKVLLKSFGLAKKSYSDVDTSVGHGELPRPFCAVEYPGRCGENVAMVSRAMLRPEEMFVPVVIVFDETYLWQRYDAAKIDGELVVVGGTWPDNSIIRAADAGVPEAFSENLAPMMLDFMIKRADYHDTVSVSSIPVAKKGHTSHAVMGHIQAVLKPALDDSVVGLLCLAYDNATNFSMANNLLLGGSLPEALRSDEFWSSARSLAVGGAAGHFGALAFKRLADGL